MTFGDVGTVDLLLGSVLVDVHFLVLLVLDKLPWWSLFVLGILDFRCKSMFLWKLHVKGWTNEDGRIPGVEWDDDVEGVQTSASVHRSAREGLHESRDT